MKKQKFLLLLPSLILFGCNVSHKYYIQNAQQVPLFKGKEEFKLNASVGGGEQSFTSDVQMAYSITDHFSVMSNYMINKMERGSSALKDSYRGVYFDGAAGYFKDFKEYGIFEIYGGVGGGAQHHSYKETVLEAVVLFIPVYQDYYRGYSNLSYIKTFIQPNYGFSFNNFDIGVSTRLAYLNFNGFDNGIIKTYNEYDKLEQLRNNSNSLLFEPAITLRGGWKFFKVQLQYAYTFHNNISSTVFEQYNFNFGLSISLGKRFFKDDYEENNSASQ